MTEAQKDFNKDFVLSLPPMEKCVLAELKQDLKKVLPGFEEEGFDEVKARSCVDTENPSHALADALVKELNEAQKVYETKGVTARFSLATDDDSNLLIRTYAEKIDGHNWSTGYWATSWTLTPENQLSGKALVHVHNFEDASNVQMRASREFEQQPIDGEDAAKAVVSRIFESDKSLLKDLSDEDAVMASLKQIRRILPITRTRMKW